MHQQTNGPHGPHGPHGPRVAVAVKPPLAISTPRRDLPLVALASGWLAQAAVRRTSIAAPKPRPWDGETISLKAFGVE